MAGPRAWMPFLLVAAGVLMGLLLGEALRPAPPDLHAETWEGARERVADLEREDDALRAR